MYSTLEFGVPAYRSHVGRIAACRVEPAWLNPTVPEHHGLPAQAVDPPGSTYDLMAGFRAKLYICR